MFTVSGMTRHFSFRRTLPTIVGSLLALAAVQPAQAQTKWTIDERSSLAWWQVNPHLNHLWATTCPSEPSWQPGDDRSAGWVIDESKLPKTGYANVSDTIHVPLYPRPVAQPICAPAVRGEISANDETSWKGAKGIISIRSDAFITGLTMRDNYAKKAVLASSNYPDVRYHLDSLSGIQTAGDTVSAMAYGKFELRGVQQEKIVPVKAWHEGKGIRVVGKFRLPPTELVEKHKVPLLSLGLGVGTNIWRDLFLGFDVVMTKGGTASSSATAN